MGDLIGTRPASSSTGAAGLAGAPPGGGADVEAGGAYWAGAGAPEVKTCCATAPRFRMIRWPLSRRSTVFRSLAAIRLTSCWRKPTFIGPGAPAVVLPPAVGVPLGFRFFSLKV